MTTRKHRQVREGGWYAKKSFAHFDLPLDFKQASKRVTDKNYVATRDFWPFVGFVDEKRRFRKKKHQAPVIDVKSRPLKYCSHHDGYIHAFYAFELSKKYEDQIKRIGIDHVVFGYRAGLGSNAQLARKVFDEIRRREKSTVIAIDIKSFFDNIDHATLQANLQTILKTARLSNDWFAVFKSMTKFAWVEIKDLAEVLKFKPTEPPRPLCTAAEFRNIVRGDNSLGPGLVQINAQKFGIPQGSPISAVFSNVYMMMFDREVREYLENIGAYYRRYSDDIIVICEPEREMEVVAFIKAAISRLGPSMQISEEKTEISRFVRNIKGVLECTQPVTYLGFTFDGATTRLRARTLSRYFRRMTYAARHAASTARKLGSMRIFMRSLYRDFTHLGKRNFYSYAKKSSAIMADETPQRQLRRHVDILKRKVLNRGR